MGTLPSQALDLLPVVGCQSGGPDDRSAAETRHETEVGKGGRGYRELDQDAIPAERAVGIIADGHAEPPHSRDLAGVPRHCRMTGGLERRHETQIGVLVQERDETTAHAAGGAGDHYVSHRIVGSALDEAERLEHRHEPLPVRLGHAAHRQTVLGLDHAHERHRLLDRDRIGLDEHGPGERKQPEM